MKDTSKNFEFKSTINNFGIIEIEHVIIPVEKIKKVIVKKFPEGTEFLIKYGFFKSFSFMAVKAENILNKIFNGEKIESVRSCGSEEIEKKFGSKNTNFYNG